MRWCSGSREHSRRERTGHDLLVDEPASLLVGVERDALHLEQTLPGTALGRLALSVRKEQCGLVCGVERSASVL